MAMLRNLVNKASEKNLFPQKNSHKQNPVESNLGEDEVLASVSIERLLSNQEFVSGLEDAVTQRLLAILSQKYNFTPTSKYLEEIENKKKYISQLDSYLNERREINHNVENELQVFLQETTQHLSKALDTFTISIQDRIQQAQSNHGVDSIKQTLFHNNGKAEEVVK